MYQQSGGGSGAISGFQLAEVHLQSRNDLLPLPGYTETSSQEMISIIIYVPSSLFVDIALYTVESISFCLYFVVLRNIDSVSLQYYILLLRSISGTFMLGLFDIICWNSKNIFSNINNLVNEDKNSLVREMFIRLA